MCKKLIGKTYAKNAQGLGRKEVPPTDDACLIFALPYCFHGVPNLSLAQDRGESAVVVTVCIACMHTSPIFFVSSAQPRKWEIRASRKKTSLAKNASTFLQNLSFIHNLHVRSYRSKSLSSQCEYMTVQQYKT